MALTLVNSGSYTTPGTPGAVSIATVVGVGTPLVYVARFDMSLIPGVETIRITGLTILAGSKTQIQQDVVGAPTPDIVTVWPFPTNGDISNLNLRLNQTVGASAFVIAWDLYSL